MSNTAPTYSEFVAKYPIFATADQSLVESQLDLTTRFLDASAWGNYYSDAVEYDVAHNITIMVQMQSGLTGGQQAAAGPISSVSAAGMSTSFESVSKSTDTDSESWYKKTGYGQMFLRLRSSVMGYGTLSV